MKEVVMRVVVIIAVLWCAVGHAATDGEFIRTWLICGPFPNPPNKAAVPGEEHIYDHTPPCVGLDTDYLVEHGGEAKIVPVAGMTHTKKDGTTVKWFEHISSLNKVVFRTAITREPNVVAYAYTTVEADQAGPYLMALGSDEGVRVWVNGEQVHDKLLWRPIREDEDLVPVTLEKGENRILVKVEQGQGGWGFIMRLGRVVPTVVTDLEGLSMSVSLRKPAAASQQEVLLVADGATIGKAVFAGRDQGVVASATIQVPFPVPGREYESVDVVVDGETLATVFPRLGLERAEEFMRATPVAQPAAFSGTKLPEIRFERPFRMEKALIGPYQLSTTYYDSAYNVVTEAATPGRYGAVVEIKTEAGGMYRRFLTLFRTKEAPREWRMDMAASQSMAEQLGIRPDAVEAYPEALADLVSREFVEGLSRGSRAAVVLAGLHEREATDAKGDYWTDPWQRDRQWWVGLKRKLYGWDKRFAEPFVCPRPIKGKPAPVLREGSPKEAGMTREGVRRIEEHLARWGAETKEAFAVCVARHGVIVLHKAYGIRDGEPMTAATESWMASSTKFLSSILMMTLVDQGLVGLDDRADHFLPPLRGRSGNKPLTIRHLYSLTSGFQGHWNVRDNDTEERLAAVLPHCEVAGISACYNGADKELGCKIVEAVTGKSLPNAYRKYLLGPLGCDRTRVNDAGGGARSIPMDFAKICQMILNGGAYGDMRFMTPESAMAMRPRDLKEILDPETAELSQVYGKFDGWYGLGTHLVRAMDASEGLGKGAFGHGAASKATVRIDPVNDMVVVMTRNGGGRNYMEYHQEFIDTILAAIDKQ